MVTVFALGGILEVLGVRPLGEYALFLAFILFLAVYIPTWYNLLGFMVQVAGPPGTTPWRGRVSCRGQGPGLKGVPTARTGPKATGWG